ncbi:MAG: hypothetical protein ACT4N5_05155 [Nitrosopumilaceae archaeon]
MQTKIGNHQIPNLFSIVLATVLVTGALTIVLPSAFTDAYAAGNGNGQSNNQEENKTTICHYPPGNPENPQTIDVADSSVQTHLDQHGDYLGECIVNEQSESESNVSQSNEESGNSNNQENKTTICHFPQGDPENPVTIDVADSSVPAHLEQHGDYIGECIVEEESINESESNESIEAESFVADNSESNESSQQVNSELIRRGGLSFDITPPATSRISFSSVEEGAPANNFGGRLTGYSNDIPTQIMNTGVEQRLQVNVYDNNGIDSIKRVVVNMFFDYLEIQKADTYFMYIEESGQLTVSDPNGFFGDVEVHRTFTETEMILTFVFTPQKPMPITDLVINAEDEYRNHQNTIIFGAFEIQGESLTSEETITAAAVIPYYKNPAWNQFVIDADGNMLTYDSFGNLDVNPAQVNDESVVYGSHIGKSERHDDGFWNKVAEEKVRAQEFSDSKFPQKSFDSQVIKTDKVFKYPSNVGKSDREDVKSMSDLKQKEHNKAMIVVQKIA